jgi:predicted AAA+ superfamily ATPase
LFKVNKLSIAGLISNDSNGTVSLQSLFEKHIDIGEISETTIEKIAFFICRGGWPNAVGRSERISLRQAVDYTEAIINTDASRVDGVQRDPNKVRWLLKSLARNIASESKASTIINDMLIDEGTMSDETLRNYVVALRRIFVVEDLPAWNPSIRSKTTIRTTPKHHFIDPSIGIAALKVSPKDLLNDFNTFGLFFESLCVRDLRIYAQSIYGDVFHYRDKSGLEADAIIHLHNGDWAAIEIKLGVNDIDEGAKNLIKLRERINTEKMKEPSFLMILTGTEFAYKRKDGIYVVPIGCLKD